MNSVSYFSRNSVSRFLAAGLLSCLAFTACVPAGDAPIEPAIDETAPLLDIIANDPDVSHFYLLIKLLGYEEKLSGEGPFTVFAMTNANVEEFLGGEFTDSLLARAQTPEVFTPQWTDILTTKYENLLLEEKLEITRGNNRITEAQNRFNKQRAGFAQYGNELPIESYYQFEYDVALIREETIKRVTPIRKEAIDLDTEIKIINLERKAFSIFLDHNIIEDKVMRIQLLAANSNVATSTIAGFDFSFLAALNASRMPLAISGDRLSASVLEDGTVSVANGEIVRADVLASNGVLHVIARRRDADEAKDIARKMLAQPPASE
jgi:uncharacterized surface protein with fasciclin (FAS1) repeats